MATGYRIANPEITDEEALGRYISAVEPFPDARRARSINRGGAHEAVEGRRGPVTPVVELSGHQRAPDFHRSDAYQEVARTGLAGSRGDRLVIESRDLAQRT